MSDDVCDLTAKQCIPCRGGVPPLAGKELADLTQQLGHEWRVVDGHHLEKEFTFPDFKSALAFTNRVGALAETEDHHPAILTEWGRVTIGWWTHVVGGLHRNDFVMAAQTDRAQPPAMS